MCQFLSKLLLQYYTTKSRTKLVSRSPSHKQQNCFATQEKPFCQTLKGVHYESGTQKCRRLDAACDKEEESPSSDDDDDEDEGVVTKMKPLKKVQESELDHWMKVKHVTLKLPSNFPLGPLHPPVLCHIPYFTQISLSRFPFTFQLTLSNFKKLHEIQNLIISDDFSFKCFKKWPSTLPKIKYKNTIKCSFEPKK